MGPVAPAARGARSWLPFVTCPGRGQPFGWLGAAPKAFAVVALISLVCLTTSFAQTAIYLRFQQLQLYISWLTLPFAAVDRALPSLRPRETRNKHKTPSPTPVAAPSRWQTQQQKKSRRTTASVYNESS